MLAFVFYVVAAYVVVVGSLALLLFLILFGRRVIDARAKPPFIQGEDLYRDNFFDPRRAYEARVSLDKLLAILRAGRPHSEARVTVAGSDEEAFAKLADEGRVLLTREAKDV